MEGISPGMSERGSDSHAMAVTGGARAGHPPSMTSNCQELGVGYLPPSLMTATDNVPQVGDLGCGNTTTRGRG
ncbi:hypothetical protein M0804_013167 [Polistes exclamans]|nr:hypothetical protein M0804_013167 [Polistes exclamans]